MQRDVGLRQANDFMARMGLGNGEFAEAGVEARDGGEGNGACRCVLGRDDERLVDSATLSPFLNSALGFEYLEAKWAQDGNLIP